MRLRLIGYGRSWATTIVSVFVFGFVLVLAPGVVFAELPEESAAKALQALHVAEARELLETTLRSGGLPRDRLLNVRALLAEATAISEGAEAGEREFRRLLVLDPDRAAPTRKSPVVSVPFSHARGFVAQNGSLRIAAEPVLAQPMEIKVRILSDPLAMVARACVFLRTQGDASFTRLPGRALQQEVPPAAPGQTRTYYVEALDAADNVLAITPEQTLPSAEVVATTPPPRMPFAAPILETSVPPPAPPSRRLLYAGIGVGVLGLTLLGTAIGLDQAGVSEFNSLSSRCNGQCNESDLGTFHLEKNGAYVTYAFAAGGLAASAVLITLDRVKAAHRAR